MSIDGVMLSPPNIFSRSRLLDATDPQEARDEGSTADHSGTERAELTEGARDSAAACADESDRQFGGHAKDPGGDLAHVLIATPARVSVSGPGGAGSRPASGYQYRYTSAYMYSSSAGGSTIQVGVRSKLRPRLPLSMRSAAAPPPQANLPPPPTRGPQELRAAACRLLLQDLERGAHGVEQDP